MFNSFWRRKAAVSAFGVPAVEMMEQRRLFAASVLPAAMTAHIPSGEYPIGTILPSTGLQRAQTLVQISSVRPVISNSGNTPSQIGPQADLLSGGISVYPYGWTDNRPGSWAPLPETTPSSASLDVPGNYDGFVIGGISFDSADATGKLGGSFNIALSTGNPDGGDSRAFVEGGADIQYETGMVFSYISILSPGTGWSSSDAGVSEFAPVEDYEIDDLGSVGVGLPLSQDPNAEMIDHLFFFAEARDASGPPDYEIANTDVNSFITFSYYEGVDFPVPEDVNGDGVVDQADITFQGNAGGAKDIDNNSVIDEYDLAAIFNSLDTVPGDFDLNGTVDFNDYLILQSNFGKNGTYGQGDANGDLSINFNDYLIMQANFGYGS